MNGNDYWSWAITKEMKNVRIAFDIKEDRKDIPPTHKFLTVKMIFDVRMDFTHKSETCQRGHLTDGPASMVYSSVVSRDSVRIVLTIAALNGLDIFCADVGNVCLNVKPREKYFIQCGPEFGSDEGKFAIMV
mmetsp:Transcript_34843/g.80555  ORF Transcript_34843/g.80555 Transcript_34843/m.80555 type:complete len:132 (-) Transcript_34843:1593-1988(-)